MVFRLLVSLMVEAVSIRRDMDRWEVNISAVIHQGKYRQYDDSVYVYMICCNIMKPITGHITETVYSDAKGFR